MLIGQEGWLAPAFHAEDYSMSTRQGPLDMTKIKFYVSRSRRSAFVIALLVCAAFAIYFAGARADAARFFTKAFASRTDSSTQRQLSFADRIAYQRAIEEVYWRHRIWPAERTDLKPALDAVIPTAEIEKKVEDYLLNSQALEDYWRKPLTGE